VPEEQSAVYIWFLIAAWCVRTVHKLQMRGWLPMSERDRRALAMQEERENFYASMDAETLSSAWQALQPGMDKMQVRSRLGDPSFVITRKDTSTWRYEERETHAIVDFDWHGRVVRIVPPARAGSDSAGSGSSPSD
jgi:hypothetical protein